MEKACKRYFLKITGVNTIEADVTPEESVKILKDAVPVYYDLEHPALIKIVEAYAYKKFYIAVFEWADGECMFDHWNFEKYKTDSTIKSPKEKFKELPPGKKIIVTDVLFSFLDNVNKKGYVAVGFYDGSIMYNFKTDHTALRSLMHNYYQDVLVLKDYLLRQ